VNGPDAGRTVHRIAGDLTLDEAIQPWAAAGVPTLIADHCGLFAFDAADPAEIAAAHGRILDFCGPTYDRCSS